jgi:hypothetical protein
MQEAQKEREPHQQLEAIGLCEPIVMQEAII